MAKITSAFGDAALLAKKAGFDMIQVHGDRMCGSFSSTIFNNRKDKYGGTTENRGRFAVEAVAAVREKLPDFPMEGCFLKYCDETRKYTKLPICGVGGLSSPDFIEEQIKNGRIQCAAMSRQLLADPSWVNKTATGQQSTIRRCVRCNIKCLGGLKQHQGAHCIYDKEEK